ncbi:hypothetical protein D0U04_11975 [Bacillus clarus]|uniref:Transposase n=1 Tax=Bacillus clarus TaxID=2338372 RepID=A0ABX9KW52_9BACI|nr:hypothetical protein D0U04_11975 [Bacillus clarus]
MKFPLNKLERFCEWLEEETRGLCLCHHLSRYLRAVRLPPQNSAEAKKLGGSRAARKSPIGVG